MCACAVSFCQLVSPHIHKKVSDGENRSFLGESEEKESEDRAREKEQKNGKTALY